MTSEPLNPKLPLLPFFLADLIFIGGALMVYDLASRPLQPWQACLLVAFVVAAAWSMVFPFVRQDSSSQAMARVKAMSECVAQINHLDQVSGQIAAATGQWQSVQEYAVKISDATKEVSNAMTEEARKFAEILEKANDAEKNHLRVEVDKMRRLEMEWLQVSTRMLDHVHALYLAAERSKMANLVAQIGQFQEACRDSARRVGLMVIEAQPGDAFDGGLHELTDPQAAIPANTVVERTLATGYSYQGRLLRKVLVSLQEAPAAAPVTEAPAQAQETSETPEPVTEKETPPLPTTGELGL